MFLKKCLLERFPFLKNHGQQESWSLTRINHQLWSPKKFGISKHFFLFFYKNRNRLYRALIWLAVLSTIFHCNWICINAGHNYRLDLLNGTTWCVAHCCRPSGKFVWHFVIFSRPGSTWRTNFQFSFSTWGKFFLLPNQLRSRWNDQNGHSQADN